MPTFTSTTQAPHLLNNKIPPPVVVVLVGIAMWAVARIDPPAPVDRTLRFTAAGIVGLAGLSILVLGVRAFRREKTTIDPVRIERASALVSRGIYRYTRNPMYVGFTTLLIGWAIALAVPIAIAGPFAFALFITRFQILPEERVMRSKFGDEYVAYLKRVRRWV